MSLLADLRKEKLRSRHPDEHVFRITSSQEREIIDACRGGVFDLLDKHNQPEHIAHLFGCRVEVVD